MSTHDLVTKGAVGWMASNPVAANLLMILLLLGGILMSGKIKQEVFPAFELDEVTISVPYPSASPEEVENGIILATEEAVRGLDGVKRVTSTATEGTGTVVVELLNNADTQKALQDIKAAVDRITSYPEEAESPTVSLPTIQREVINVAIYGDQNEHVLRATAEQIRDEILQEDGITVVDLSGARDPEITVEIPQDTLRAYNLTLADVATIIGQTAQEIPGGSVKTQNGEILLRMSERREYGPEFENIPIISNSDGTVVTLGEIATVSESFEDSDMSANFNGKPAIMVNVYSIGDQKPIDVANVVKAYIAKTNPTLPEGLHLAVMNDMSDVFAQRIDLLMRNAVMGLCLVFIALGLFLEIRLAFWVMLGIPVSFLGTMLLMPGMDVSINMISLFAFIMALGIVVDDAIVVGENVYDWRQRGDNPMHAAIFGARQVSVPVVFSVLTNVVSFLPLALIPGTFGKLFLVIPAVVCTIFLLSLVESLFILPAHLSHQHKHRDNGLYGMIHKRQQKIGKWLENMIEFHYLPFIRKATEHRYVTLTAFVGVLVLLVGYYFGGRLRITDRPEIEGDNVTASLVLPYGSPVEATDDLRSRLEQTALQVVKENGGDKILKGIWGLTSDSNECKVRVFLVSSDERDISVSQFTQKWRKLMGEVVGVESLTYSATMGPGDRVALEVELGHTDIPTLEAAAADFGRELEKFSSVRDVDDGFEEGKPQLNMTLKPAARGQGLTVSDIGKQIRSAFYGAEALRQQRGRDEVKVMVRRPLSERTSEYDVENMLIRTDGGGEIPLHEAVEMHRDHAYTSIKRIDGRRILAVNCGIEPIEDTQLIKQAVYTGSTDKDGNHKPAILEELKKKYPGLTVEEGGPGRDFNESMATLKTGFIFAVLVIYAMLAVPFKSYFQPLIVMISIPFGIIGAAIGHILMGYTMGMTSMFGIIALAGVVVNDSLVLVDYANNLRREGASAVEAAVQAGTRRFRPIILTSLTTFIGLAPMIFETSVQAKFLVPMGLSLGYGILFSTLVALILVPCLYIMIEHAKETVSRWFRGDSAEEYYATIDGPRMTENESHLG